MSNCRQVILFAFCLLASQLYAGERIVGDFRPGLAQESEVLKHVPVKVLVTEFIDPQASGLGISLGYMLWREALTAVHDQRGAGIIYAHTAGDTPLATLLRRDYHLAALEIARAQKARIVLWGAVAEEGGQVYIDSYLTLLPELIGESLSLTLESEGTPLPGFSTEVSRSRYSFAQIKYPRDQLFKRSVITRASTKLRKRPAKDALVVAEVDANTVLQALDMHGSWFQVEIDGGKRAWVEIGRLEIPPRSARINRDQINIRQGPGKAPVLRQMNLRGEYRIVDRRFVPGSGVWYQLQFSWGKGWVAAFLTQPRFTLPITQFMAGLQRYQLNNYREAAKSFAQYIAESEGRETNVNLAAANALQGSSLVMINIHSRKAEKAIAQAVALTPYDPLVYNLRMLTSLYASGSPARRSERMVNDLGQALKLDPRNPRTLALLDALIALSRMERLEYRALRHSFWMQDSTREKLLELQQTYLRE